MSVIDQATRPSGSKQGRSVLTALPRAGNWALLIGIIGCAPAYAQPACTVPQGWSKPTQARAALAAEMRYALKPGQAVDLALAPLAKVRFVAEPGRKSKPDSHAGLAALEVARTGAVEIALSNRAYVDLVRNGAVVRSSAHREGCGGVRKIVSFPVVPGRYVVQIADAPEANVRMSITQ